MNPSPGSSTQARSPGRGGPLSNLLNALASLRVAVLTMLVLALVCITATFYESRHGTAAAQRDFYQTRWFTFLLMVLGLNVLFSMLRRFPWKMHHAGFVLAHVGILAVLVGSLISLHAGLDSQMALYEHETSDQVALSEQALHVTLPGSLHAHLPLSGQSRLRIPGSDAVLVVEERQPHVEVGEVLEEAERGGPALHVVVEGSGVKTDGWILGADPERRRLDFGPVAVLFHAGTGGHHECCGAGANALAFSLDAAGRLRYAIFTTGGRGRSGLAAVGQVIETPWMAAGLKVTVDRFLPKAAIARHVHPAPQPEQEDGRVPAVRVRLEGSAGRSPSEWRVWGEEADLAFGQASARVGYGPAHQSLPFKVTLLDFSSETYPGSRMAATYESRVRIEDSELGNFETMISMNRPLHHRGYVFFQSSFVEGEPMMSILSVARAPGLPVVYAGTALLTLGVAWMFYLKPVLARRQARRALHGRVAHTVGAPVPNTTG